MRKSAAVTIATALSAAAVVAAPTHAHAGLPLLQCTGNIHTTYTPGLTDVPKPTDTTVDEAVGTSARPLGTCLVLGALITGGTHHHERVLTLSCLSLLQSTPITETVTWNNGSSSTFSFPTSSYDDVNGETVITRVGTVTAGFGAGAPAQQEVVLANTALLGCSTPAGVTTIDGATTLTIV
ncbi:MAG: hypothetical protein HOV83_13675 [Catenulispora sp.]|nr:hypothetical protein [Catenulispora sp.]